jgi:hypothetical protein
MGSDDGIVITNLVMTFPQLSSTHENAISTCAKGFDDEYRVHSTSTHDPDHPDVRWILKTGNPSGVRRCVATPVTEKAQYFRLK